jgi:hypothetical protein
MHSRMAFEVSIVTYKVCKSCKVSWPQCCWNANSTLRAFDYSCCDLNSHTIDREPTSTCKVEVTQIPHGLCKSFVSFHATNTTSSLKRRGLFPLALVFSGPRPSALTSVCAPPPCVASPPLRTHLCLDALTACAPLHCIHIPAPCTLRRHPRPLHPCPRPPSMSVLLCSAVTPLAFARSVCAPVPCISAAVPVNAPLPYAAPPHCSALLSLAPAPYPRHLCMCLHCPHLLPCLKRKWRGLYFVLFRKFVYYIDNKRTF